MDGVTTATVWAAGGVVWRRTPSGVTDVLLVHRPKYDDWTLPKGKLHEGESGEEAALREVAEETGLRCALGPELAAVSYEDREGRQKTVRYWAMEPVDGAFRANAEVDEVCWLALDEAAEQLSYERDRDVLTSFRPDP